MRKQRLTKERALWLCYELWTWLAKTGERKEAWPRLKQVCLQYGALYFDCPACEYAVRNKHPRDHHRCISCPLKGLWPGDGALLGDPDCIIRPSPFILWHNEDDPDIRKPYAQEIADAALLLWAAEVMGIKF